MNRLLGIDYGEKRVGLAISDEGAKLAFPFKIIKNDPSLLDTIHNICGEQNIGKIVLGESLNFSGQHNEIMGKILKFKEELSKLGLPIYFEKEFLTTIEARGRKGKEKNNARKNRNPNLEKKVDASAAALILQRFLDKMNKNDFN